MNGKAKSVWYLLGLLPAVWLGLLGGPAAPRRITEGTGPEHRRQIIALA